jgi:flavin reductase (DIM6/NTAB) family NADH-FMN oxidoreductase RutF
MNKKPIGAGTFLYPMPTTLVGAQVGGRPNYMTIAYCGIVQHAPPIVAIALRKTRHTYLGIKENKTFSVNIPSEEMVEVTDFCGMHSGLDTDKSALFTTFYGELATAPMIEECPLNLECALARIVELGGSHDLLLGEIVQVYAAPDCLTGDLPDIEKIRPIIYSTGDRSYWRVGDRLGKAFGVGKGHKS